MGSKVKAVPNLKYKNSSSNRDPLKYVMSFDQFPLKSKIREGTFTFTSSDTSFIHSASRSLELPFTTNNL